ncbi:hypothetical protein DFO61_2032 [Ectopseudomonas oleovorans]|uniref:Uncharacterized protein n=1 Tax=Ectopseudomonas oleovorans TaxID=301 RepID=A0A397N1W8_ECTOL|nr:hypothetical protein [Pseudomonas oleovorans]RIA31316.1 hypothetical protein DFO61_2032 [Pseudomonas oleovorans]
MSKTIIDNKECTVKQPTQFNADELKALQDAACQQHLAAPGSKTFTITESSFMIACQRMASLIKDGYEHDTHGYHSIKPFIIPFVKKQEKIDKDLEVVKANVKTKYENRIRDEVEQAKANLIAQRRATLDRKEREKQEKAEQKLMDELEKEASELFDSYLSFN